MDKELLLHLTYNASLLLALGIVYEISYFIPDKMKRTAPVVRGVLIGIIGILVIVFRVELTEGIIFDTRSILLSVAAFVYGPVSATIAAVMVMLYRVFVVGGAGALPGVCVIVSSVLIGLLWRRLLQKRPAKHRWLMLYLLGICVHAAMLACMLLMPDPVFVLQQITLPVIIIYPVATVLLGLVLMRQKERNEGLLLLAEAESRYKSLFQSNHAVMMLIRPEDGSIMEVNPAACRYYGWTSEEFKTKNISEINTLTHDEVLAEMASAVADERNFFEFRHRRASGEVADVEVYSGPITVNRQTLLYSIVHDVSERVASEKALADSESRFRQLVEAAPEAIFIETDQRFVFVNQAAIQLFGAQSADQLIGMSVMSRFHPNYHAFIRERIAQLRTGAPSVPVNEEVFLRLDGTPVPVDVSAISILYNNMDSAVVFSRDITERRRVESIRLEMEARQRQQQKLEAIGTLAGGVAHEINNPLSGIMNYAELILEDMGEDSQATEYARSIIEETDRIAVIVKNLLQFSRHEKQTHSYASIYDIINQTVSLIKTIIKKDQIHLDIDIKEDLPLIKCRSQQIQQVLMNLLTNARDSLNEKFPDYDENKIIRITCCGLEAEGRRWLRLTVEDRGAGISENIRERIFEPFFSTKPKEVGTGLGLSISFGIVQDHHGRIEVESKEGDYSRFILTLPVDNGWQL
jgi:PAS domain S-box-containing protein